MVIDYTNDKQDNCTGCRACVAVCPVNAIVEKKGGRLESIYEIGASCINCGRCKSVCPIDKDFYNLKADSFYCLSSKDEQAKLKSSSGGAAYQFSVSIIKAGGIVYGAGWNVDKQRVEHMRIDCLEKLSSIQGSKYVQSWIDKEIYISIQQDLKTRLVLFTGTPCQIAAVRSYTRDSENLMTVDLICHGVPSPDFLDEQLHEITNSKVEKISFRKGLDFSLFLTSNGKDYYENGYDNPFYSLFLNFAFLRENCYQCKYACQTRVGDITVGDFEEDGKGYSCVVINSKKGERLFATCQECLEFKKYPIDILSTNHAFNKPTVKHKKTDVFTQDYKKMGLVRAYNKCFRILRIKRMIKRLVGESTYNTIKGMLGR